MTVINKIKENLFLFLVVLAYIIMFIIKPPMGIESIKNSGYYIKEMLMIMPVIFVLTALLDMWVPKEKIMKFLGKDAKAKGVFLAFVVGSISAGPIYAAFPMCVMLHKKGASIRNIIIILSSWAVIKVPMLLNETKFLGPKFMAIRWILTVIAIIIFSWIASKVLKDEDLPGETVTKTGLSLNRDACMGCTLCAKNYSEIFEIQGRKAMIKTYDKTTIDKEKLQNMIKACPVNAIEYIEE
ncbi:putative permease [Clostridium liquoris]|uniref:Putative permease n=1 Tax=Clostridium liquoris TaxID=1289519 RepID=A0A2T0B2C5_9CLOT|nr:permease [Clostridium liquoris]PRR78032.1 putative permease [Clostridium liquoris]